MHILKVFLHSRSESSDSFDLWIWPKCKSHVSKVIEASIKRLKKVNLTLVWVTVYIQRLITEFVYHRLKNSGGLGQEGHWRDGKRRFKWLQLMRSINLLYALRPLQINFTPAASRLIMWQRAGNVPALSGWRSPDSRTDTAANTHPVTQTDKRTDRQTSQTCTRTDTAQSEKDGQSGSSSPNSIPTLLCFFTNAFGWTCKKKVAPRTRTSRSARGQTLTQQSGEQPETWCRTCMFLSRHLKKWQNPNLTQLPLWIH